MDVARGALSEDGVNSAAAPRAGSAAAGPPQLPFVLTVGITGHRIDALAGDAGEALRRRLAAALQVITDSARAVHAGEPTLFGSHEPRFDFVTALAGGADQLGAQAALDLGYSISAVLPFQRDDYRRTLVENGDLGDFDALLAQSERVLELPGRLDDRLDGYVMVGRATVAHCDILIAVWDGQKARGPGGTGDVVQTAIERGTPVVHIPPDPAEEPRLLWAAFDPVVSAAATDRVERSDRCRDAERRFPHR